MIVLGIILFIILLFIYCSCKVASIADDRIEHFLDK